MADSKPRVLLIDDDAVIRRVAERHLGADGYDVIGVGDAEAGLDRLRAGTYDAVVLDNGLPGMMGVMALPKILALTKAPVVMITGFPNEDVHKDALLLGARAFLSKPFEFAQLSATLRGLIGRPRPGA